MNTHPVKYLKDYRPAPFVVDRIDLKFDIFEDQTLVTSSMQIHKNRSVADESTPLVFNKGVYEITSVVADGMVLLPGEYQADDISFKLFQTPESFTLEITSILNPAKNTSLEGLYKSGNIVCTQCEAQGFRKITPYPDRPDVMAVFSCTLIADRNLYPVLLSNGNPVSAGQIGNNRHYVRWEDPFKKPCYLFALVAGDLAFIHDRFTTASGRAVDLKIYTEKENIHKCGHAMASLKQAMKWDEQRFGLEYDLDLYQIVAINDFNAGAMENKGLNIFNSKYVLANPETATDDDFLNIQGVIGHEYFHNWTGNRVTLKNWFQLSLKEGLTVFRDQEFSSDLNSRAVKRISCVKNLRASQFPEDSGPMTHPVRPESYIKMDNFYTMTVYEKGGELIRMIHHLLGESGFRKGMALYFKKFDGMAVTTEDFVSVMEEAASIDLTQFKRWYSQSGTPRINFKRDYDPDLKILTLTFEQRTSPDRNQKEKLPLHIPVRFGLMDDTGRDITPENASLLHLKSEKQTFVFKDIGPNVFPSVFRQFSAPVKLTTDFSDTDLAFLMAHDSDEFNRWDAAQSLFIKEIQQLVTAIQEKRHTTISAVLVTAFKKAMGNPDADRAFLAKVLQLPQETEIKDHYEAIDVKGIHLARSFLKQGLARQLKQEFYDTIERCSLSDPMSLAPGACADRSLKNLSLSYLGSLKEKETTALVFRSFETAKNMTDEFAAFRILSQIDPGTRQDSAMAFYEKWHQDKLVLDKWFSVQAGAGLEDTLDIVETLMGHPDFSLANPNKVRSLIYTFAFNNPINFHRSDGKGYTFICDQILRLDRINHQIAARLSSSFNQWKKYNGGRQTLMKKALETIMADQALSKNVFEIVSRALE
ncbi:MAG: aminopeptidase N [Proteobacteria bacterium]|nr:aminopeptidase N [Desulfobacula sp.]MBU4130851.1 aminopeptidase N [Pseudomonadota bacterium]